MKKNIIKTSIVLYGEIKNDSVIWKKWYEYAKSFIEKVGYCPNYVGISGQSFKSKHILSISRIEKKFIKTVENGETFDSLEVYSLPPNFNQAAFDYEIHMARICSYEPHFILATLLQKDFLKIDVDNVINELKEFINFKNGQIFEMTNPESPFFYAAKVNPVSYYKSLKILKEI
ncbi:hypothetical protein [Acetivibrio saccincola]|jgi:hypothetical protein|uniref:Uncharacterized protein n=1 Tax=Acetivibrio saccincola TaxID=1677857 RepID=A0A2S8R6L3_9FIRM|nr:hypothetical protein [Acetivibrio saccincola]NLP45410.1 hypothetical protein [Peptococcaceae bacterium]PQQ65435.1 hypothetical protein B9R14_00695 [Acetivibrio saccincola]